MPPPPEFLLVDDQASTRSLLAQALLRQYPDARLHECEDSEIALVLARRSSLTAAIVHRAMDVSGLPLVGLLRAANPGLRILFFSRPDLSAQAAQTGASAVLNYAGWLGLGAAVEEMLRSGASSAPFALDPQPTASCREGVPA